jgi:hypothetical protein
MQHCEQSDEGMYSQQTVVLAALGSFACFCLAYMIFVLVSDSFAFDGQVQIAVSALISIVVTFLILHHRHFLSDMAKIRRLFCLSLLSCGIFCGLFILTTFVVFVSIVLLTFATRSPYWIPQ